MIPALLLLAGSLTLSILAGMLLSARELGRVEVLTADEAEKILARTAERVRGGPSHEHAPRGD